MNAEQAVKTVPRCDYEGSNYQADFWTAARAYEDQAERYALRAMVPPRGRRIVEIGAGAGRLGDLYTGYNEIYLVDYAQSQLEQACARWGHDPRFVFVQGDIYSLPFPTSYFDTVVTVRVLHHIKDVPAALREIARIVAPRGVYVTEYANKRNLKALLRYALGKAKPGENPFTLDPFEFVALNIDFHPRYMAKELEQVGFVTRSERAASFFRLAPLKRLIPAALLAKADAMLQRVAAPLRLTPSIFLENQLPKASEGSEQGWRCPACHSSDFMTSSSEVTCESCGVSYPLENGIYLFRRETN